MLDWRRIHPDASGSHSKCMSYSVCRTNDQGTLWEVWKLAPGGPWFALLEKNLSSEEAARSRAEADVADGERKRA